ncbi:aldehyde dehydrogenase family protein [Geodermatophilus sp. TF02-6]|uniref:aldehyde dehydrogenase family protein n=1 Tax=Geodermatophilus sp. TF02-6 TaxID=2250575 RepID=UPI000DE9B695|nr:aldehyde dehydrogenase family protein [Geodermatophilus sp. TF02-6]RBY79905.1 aldehyde dehydrogenase family protein [Geodermatophilus sp. TF02-6]
MTTITQPSQEVSGSVQDRTRLYVDGQWVASAGEGTIDVLNPATEQVIARVAEGDPADVDRAVAAARAAFPAWSALPPAERAVYLRRIGEELAAHTDELAELMSADVGTPVEIAKAVQVGLPTFTFGNFADLAESYDWAGREVGNSLVVREPVGVVAAITPWNFPMHQVALKAAAALAAGCTVVVKPSEVAPLGIYALTEIVDRVGLPPGVFNLISGPGPVVGEALVAHPGVDAVSFTGSTRAGRRIAEVAAADVKRVSLELGGKSPNVVLDDADFEAAVADTFGMCFLNSGQTCAALTRLLVPAKRLEEAEQIAKRVAETWTAGDPAEATTLIGPLVSEAQRERVRSYIRTGVEEGARLVTGGEGSDQATGYYVPPTVFSGVTADMTIAREEIFGPVLSIMPYEDEADAVSIANGTDYGLSARVWSGDPDRAMRVARQLRAGQVTINDGAFNPAAPFGGYKQSGLGREGGEDGLAEFLETKAIQR